MSRPSVPNTPGRRSFVVRIWQELGAPTGTEPVPAAGQIAATTQVDLRGSVQRVGRDAVRYFTSLDGLVDIIADDAGLESASRGGIPKAKP